MGFAQTGFHTQAGSQYGRDEALRVRGEIIVGSAFWVRYRWEEGGVVVTREGCGGVGCVELSLAVDGASSS